MPISLPPLALFVLFLFGLVVGSFANVCIVRIPEEESVVQPNSHCRHCLAPVRWYDNIPVLSWLALQGRCRDCRTPISLRYPLVELTTGILFVIVGTTGVPAREMVVELALTAALVVIAVIDYDHFIIPDVISIPSILVAPALAAIVGHISVRDSLLGIVVGGGILWGFAAGYEWLRKQEGMGFGDVKLVAMIGGIIGWGGALFTIMMGALLGSIGGGLLMAARRGKLDSEIPFGPFLAAAGYLYMVAGPAIVGWYFGRTGLFG